MLQLPSEVVGLEATSKESRILTGCLTLILLELVPEFSAQNLI